MNTWQVARQLQYLARSRKWPGSSTTVWHTDSVKITSAPREAVVEQMVMPALLIRPLGATSDPEAEEEPDVIDQEFAFTIATAQVGDSWGEYPLVGGQRSGQTSSVGRGLLEIEEELFSTIELLNTDDGVVIEHRASSATQAQLVGNRYVAVRDYLFRARVTADRYYHPVINLQEA